MKPVIRLRATLQYCHAMLVFWLAVCSEQVAIQISICCLSKRFFILEYCELTAMASNITSVSKREKVISLWSSGYRNKEICSRLHLSHQTVSNILSKFLQNGTAAPGKPGWKERTVATPNVVEFLEYCKVFKPSTRNFEIQQGLLANATCTPANLPARSTISDIVRQEGNYFFPLWNRGNVACHHSQLTIFQYEKPFAQAANWNLNRNLLGANCQSKYQHCVTILQSGEQTNNRFHCKQLRRRVYPAVPSSFDLHWRGRGDLGAREREAHVKRGIFPSPCTPKITPFHSPFKAYHAG